MTTDIELMAEEVYQSVKHYIDQREASFNRGLESLDQRFAVLESALALALEGKMNAAPESFSADQVSRAMRNELLAGK